MSELASASEVVREQYKDFIRGCAFRQTLLCHQEVELASDLLSERALALYAMCNAVPVEKPEQDGKAVFRRRGGAELTTGHPLIATALKVLSAEQPASVSVKALLDTVRSTLPEAPASLAEDEETLSHALTKAYRAGFVELYLSPFCVANRAGHCPAVSKLVQFELTRGETATNQLHTSIRFPDPVSRQLIVLLDGTRDENALVQELIGFVESGRSKIYEDGVLVQDRDQIAQVLERRVCEGLKSLAQEGMLAC